MNPPLFLRPEAERDIAGAYRWYEERRSGLGEEFLGCLEAAFETIRRNPTLPRRVHREVRRVLVRRFPYGVHYVVEAERLVVLAVFHGRRDPEVWESRAGSDASGQEK